MPANLPGTRRIPSLSVNISVIVLLSWIVFCAAFLACPPAHADGYPPYWDNSTGSVHFTVLPWPSDAEFASRYYTHQGVQIKDSRLSSDGSNGGRAPQNYANVSSSCIGLPDQVSPSVAWFYKETYRTIVSPTLYFRWRVEQIPNTYATGPLTQVYSNVDPYFAAQWTVLIDIDGDGYREFAVNIDGNSGSPSTSVDVIKSIYSNTRTQSLDYFDPATGKGDPNISYLFHQPTAFAYKSFGGDPLAAYNDYLLNFRNTFNPTPVWPNGSAETVWDYGSTRVQNISTAGCNEFLVDYQIPLAMLDATAVGGPKVTKDTPMCFTFVTANSNQDPLQKDVAFNTNYTFTPEGCVPCGDLVTLAGGVIPQPVIDQVTAAGCGPTTFTARIRDAITETCAATVNTTTSAPRFLAYFDRNANGVADDGSTWTSLGTGSSVAGNPGLFTLTVSTATMNAGQYLVGVQAIDNQGNRTFSYLDAAEVAALSPTPGETFYANPTPEPGVLTAVFRNTCGATASLTKSVSPAYVAGGDVVTFTLTVNNGTSSAFNVSSLSDSLPPGFSFQNAAPPAGAAAESGSLAGSIVTSPADSAVGDITWTFAGAGSSVASGASKTLIFTAQAAPSAGTFTNSAVAVTTAPDWGTLASNIVDVGVGAPALTIAKRASVARASPGDTVTYTITYSNDSPVSATGVAVLDTLPAGLTFAGASAGGAYAATASTVLGTDGNTYTCIKNHVAEAANRPITGASWATYWVQSGSGGAAWSSGAAYHEPRTITWQVGNLAAGDGPFTLTCQVVVDQSANPRTENTATIDSNETSPAAATTAIYVPSPLQISKTGNKTIVDPRNLTGPLAPFNQVIYTISYKNTGAGALTGTSITDTTMPGFTYAACSGACTTAEPAGDGYGNDNGACEAGEPCTVTWSPGGLAAGASGSVTLTLTVANPYNLAFANPATNTATIDTNETGPFSDGASVAIREYDCGGVGTTYFFHDLDASALPAPWVGTPGTPLPSSATRSYATTTAPVNPTATNFTVNIADGTVLELAQFYQSPPLSKTSGFSVTGTIDMQIYYSKNSGGPIRIFCDLYDYNSTTGESVQIGTQAADSASPAADNAQAVFSITPTGIVRAGNLLLWRFSTQQKTGAYTGPVSLHYDGANDNPASGTAGYSWGRACFAPVSVTLNKTVNLLEAAPGAALQYTILFTNSGQRDVSGATIIDTLPAGVTFVPAGTTLNGAALTSNCPTPGSNQYCVSGQTITFDAHTSGTATAGLLQGGGQGTLVVNVTINNPLAAGISSLTNLARITTSSTDPVEDQATTDVTLTPVPDVFLQKSVDRTLLNPGDTVTYTVTAVNLGAGTANNIVVTDVVPADTYFTYVGGSIAGGNSRSVAGNTLSWTITTLAPGDSASLTFQMLVAAAGVPAGVTYKDNFASATEASTSPPNSNTVRVSITTNPNLALTKTVTSPVVTAGLGTGDGTKKVFTSTLVDTAVTARSVKVYVAGAQAGTDNGAGAVTGPNLTGSTVNYATNALSLTFVAAPTAGQAISATYVKEVSPGVSVQFSLDIGSGDGSRTTFSATLTDNQIQAGSAAVLVASAAVGADSGTGQLLGNNLAASTIDYSSGAVRLEFLTAPSNGQAVALSYRKQLSPGTTVQYTMTVTNNGGSAATGVVVNDPVPAGTTYVAGSMTYDGVAQTDAADTDSGSYNGVAGRVSFSPGVMAADTTHTLRFSVILDGSYSDGATAVPNTATAQAVNTASKSASAGVVVLTAPRLTLSKSGPATVAYPLSNVTARTGNILGLTTSMYVEVGNYVYIPGAAPPYRLVTAIDTAGPPAAPNITVGGAALAATPAAIYPVIAYTLTYTNAGTASAPTARVKDILPTGLNYLTATPAPTTAPASDTNGYLVWDLGTLASGASGQITVLTRPTGAGSPYSNTATMSSPTVPEFPSNTVVTAAGGLLVAKSTSTPNIVNNPADGTPETATYTITLTNQTAGAVTGLRVEDILPNTFLYAGGAATVTPAGACTGGAAPTVVAGASVQIYWTGCQVAASGSTTLQFNVNIGVTVSAGTYQNPVAVTGPAGVNILPFDELLTGNEDVSVVIPGDIKVSKIVTSPPAACAQGTCVSYRITAANVGTAAATGVVIADRDSAGTAWPPAASLTYVTSTASPVSTTFDPVTGNWAIPNLASGAFATLDLTFSVNPFSSAITNCAIRTASNPNDSNPANDKACADIVPTRVILSSFDAFAVNGRVVVEWTTAVETDTAGFYLYRLDQRSGSYLPLDSKLLPAVLGSPQGGTYRYLDHDARPGEEYTYLLVEMEAAGAAVPYGPFTLRPQARHSADSALDDAVDFAGSFSRRPRGLTAAKSNRLEKARSANAGASAADKPATVVAGADSVKVYADQDGLSFVSASRIAALMGLGEGTVRRMIGKGQFAFESRGTPVAYLPAADNAGFYFYAQRLESIYSARNVYWLSRGRGTVMSSLAGKGPVPGEISVVRQTLRAEQDLVPLTSPMMHADQDFWFWGYVVAGYPSLDGKELPFTAAAPLDGGEVATLNVHLQGFTATEASLEHHVVLRLNGVYVGESRWDGAQAHDVVVGIEPGLLHEGANTLAVEGVLDAGVPYSVFFIDSFDIVYSRRAVAAGNSLLVQSDQSAPLTVGGFDTGELLVLDLTDPSQPRVNLASTVRFDVNGYQATFRAAAAGAANLVAAVSAARELQPVADEPSTLRNRANRADYLVLAPHLLLNAAAAFADYRRSQGLESMVVAIEDVFDEFSAGIATPEALKAFLAFTAASWRKTPRYVLLLGDGSLDYKDNLGFGENLVPALMVDTPLGIFPADGLYADVDGDHRPDMAVGRIPVLTPAEAAAVLGKIKTSEGKTGNVVIMLSDRADQGGDFPVDSWEMSTLIPAGYDVRTISLESFDINAARSMLINAWQKGTVVVNYIGHGGVNVLSNQGLLSNADVPALQSTGRLPVVSAFTCMAGEYSFPGYDSLSEALLLDGTAGALAVWAPSGMSYNSLAKTLNAGYFQGAFSGRSALLGDAVLRGYQEYSASGGPFFMMDIYNLLGDPALRLR